MGIPEDVPTNQGTQFMSECMQEISRLLGIKGLTSTPYHPIFNGLVERWNETLKSSSKVHAEEALPEPAEAVAQIDRPCFVHLQRSSLEVDRI